MSRAAVDELVKYVTVAILMRKVLLLEVKPSFFTGLA